MPFLGEERRPVLGGSIGTRFQEWTHSRKYENHHHTWGQSLGDSTVMGTSGAYLAARNPVVASPSAARLSVNSHLFLYPWEGRKGGKGGKIVNMI